MPESRRLLIVPTLLALAGLAAAVAPACGTPEGCLAGDDGRCLPVSACEALAYACEEPSVEVRTVLTTDQRPPGLSALASGGDVVLENERLVVVIDAIDHPHYLAPSGGNVLDMVVKSGNAGDSLRAISQTIGILPDDAASYHSLEILDRADDDDDAYVAVVVRGQLDGYPDISVVTRYELRPCEPGLRVRTELYHGGLDPLAVFLSDAFYWGDRQMTPFVPLHGQGFEQPELDLIEIDKAYRRFPWFAARDHTDGGSAYAVMPCGERDSLDGFHAAQVSVVGLPRSLLRPGDGLALERFLFTGAHVGLAAVVNNVLPARASLHGEAFVTVSGSVTDEDGGPLGGDARLASLLFYEPAPGDDPDAVDGRTPITEVVPAADGSFEVRLPALASYRVERHAFGRALSGATSFEVEADDLTLQPIPFPGAGVVTASVVDGAGAPLIAEVVLVPRGDTTAADVNGSSYGFFDEDHCAPWLGPPHGGSPACNRALLDGTGEVSFAAPAGTYWAYATKGPFWTLARQELEVTAGGAPTISLELAPLDLVPDGALSGDFHVHAGPSFDSSFPERDRALTFASQGMDVIAATDHDVVTSYEAALAAVGLTDSVRVMPGIETTGHILFLEPPGASIPKVVGHYNFWPLEYDPLAYKNGGIDDERVEPGALFDAIDVQTEGRAVRQLNHPFADALFGRDEGYLTAIGYDPRVAVPAAPDDTSEGQLVRRPGGEEGLRNIDHHVQEVMNGSSTLGFHRYRAAWFSFLSQGILRGGTANSDSHSLAVEVLGTPRSLVFADTTVAEFDEDVFNEAIRDGRIVGTNGPVLTAWVDAAEGDPAEPSITPFEPADDGELHVSVRAAPWIRVDEVRIIVNGTVAEVLTVPEADRQPEDPFGTSVLDRLEASVPLADLLPGSGDAWIVVEAGRPLLEVADTDDDGVPDTTDNDGDGVIGDLDQVDRDEDDWYEEPEPPGEDDPGFHLESVAPGTWPTAFTNPFLVDRDGDGWTAPGVTP